MGDMAVVRNKSNVMNTSSIMITIGRMITIGGVDVIALSTSFIKSATAKILAATSNPSVKI